MTASIENIVQHLFHQPTLQTVSVDELQQMTQEYPSFAAARFLLLKKMQETGHPDFSSQLHKTAVYFNNPLWLQLLLLPAKETGAWQPSNGHSQPPELPHLRTVVEERDLLQEQELLEQQEEQAAGKREPVAANESIIQEVLNRLRGNIHEASSPQEQPGSEEPLIQEILGRLRGHIHEASGKQEWQEPLTPSEQFDPIVQEILGRLRGHIHEAESTPQEQQEWPEQYAAPQEAQPAVQQQPEQTHEPLAQEILDRLREHIHDAGNTPETAIEEAPGQPMAQEAPVTEAPEPPVQIPAEIAAEEEGLKEEDFAPPFQDPDPEPVQAVAEAPAAPTLEAYAAPAEEPPLVKTIIETPSAQQDVLFEPYHTIDYFASLGIRLDKMEPNPQDKLGKQLRSFTEWLKSMKKLPQASIEKVLGENEESAVVAAASHSVVGKDIITEAMAEVFEKQGLYEKAAEVYRKLSLLNPSKSAYFADRINALKRD